MQSVLAVFKAASASFNFFTTVAKSPSAVVYPSVEASLADLSLLTSLVSASICSSRLCFIVEYCAAMDSAFLASVCLHPLHLTIGCTRATYAKTCQDVQLICVSSALVLIMKSMAHLCMKRLLRTIPQSQSCLDIADRFPHPCVELLFIRRGLLLKLMAHLWWRRLLWTAPHLEVAIFSGYLTVCPSAA